jgi:transposase
MPAKFVKAFNIGNKSNRADARAIWMATQMASKPVAVKTEAQLAVLALRRLRPTANQVPRHADEQSASLAHRIRRGDGKEWAALGNAIPGVLARLPTMLIASLRARRRDRERLDRQIADIERLLQAWMKKDRNCRDSQCGAADSNSHRCHYGRREGVKVGGAAEFLDGFMSSARGSPGIQPD